MIPSDTLEATTSIQYIHPLLILIHALSFLGVLGMIQTTEVDRHPIALDHGKRGHRIRAFLLEDEYLGEDDLVERECFDTDDEYRMK